jgi:hypothetical protein
MTILHFLVATLNFPRTTAASGQAWPTCMAIKNEGAGVCTPRRPEEKSNHYLAMGPAAVVPAATVISTTCISMCHQRTVIRIPWPTVSRYRMPIDRMAVIPAAVIRMAVIAVIPGARSDERAAYEPAGPVEAVRRASVRKVAVIAVSANRGRANAHSDRPHANAHGNLRARAASHNKKQNSQKRKIF